MKKQKLQYIALLIILLALVLITMTGCSDRDSKKVSYNISKDADNFKVMRRIINVNLRTDTVLFELTGYCSIADESRRMIVTCQTGKNTYQKHFFEKSTETAYTIEDLGDNEVNKYKYTFYFKPETIIPIEIKGE